MTKQSHAWRITLDATSVCYTVSYDAPLDAVGVSVYIADPTRALDLSLVFSIHQIPIVEELLAALVAKRDTARLSTAARSDEAVTYTDPDQKEF